MIFMKEEFKAGEIGLGTMEQVAISNISEVEFTMDLGDVKTEEFNKVGVVEKTKRILIAAWEKLLDCKRISQDQWHQYFCGDQNERTRVYHVWPGNNVFFCRGRLVCGPDPKGLLLTAVSISLSSWIFVVYVAYDLPTYSGLTTTFSVILTTIVLVNLGMVSMIDPGIIPRNDRAFCAEQTGTSNRIKTKRVIVNGVDVKLKYCHICKIYRPPRSCHCAICDNCVEKFDHHCPWIGQCIGLRNYWYYLTFLITALVFFIYSFAFSCKGIHRTMLLNGIGIFGIVKSQAETLAVASFSFAAICFVGGISCYHIYLIATNQTTYESFRGRYVGSKSPYDSGIMNNVKEVLFMRVPPSRVDFRAEITQWGSGSRDIDRM